MTQVLSEKKPELYKLVDLLQAPVKGFFYREQLTKSEKPDYKKGWFTVEKILRRKTVKKKKFFFVKFAFYPKYISLCAMINLNPLFLSNRVTVAVRFYKGTLHCNLA